MSNTLTYKGASSVVPNTEFVIQIDPSKDALVGTAGLAMLADRYFTEEETLAQHLFARVSCALSDTQEMAQNVYTYMSNLWFMPATPILTNAGTSRGLTISCYLNDVADSIKGLTDNFTENAFLSVNGGGIGSNWSNVRSIGTPTSRGSYTSGAIAFMKQTDALVESYWQGGTRRGAAAVYLSVSHPEIEEFLEIRKPTGGDANRKCLNLHHAVSIPDSFMEAVMSGSDWTLTDPHTKLPVKTTKARDLWMKILEMRMVTGEPYLFFVDTVNRNVHPTLRKQDYYVGCSNLCSEIMLKTAPDYTAVCCLSSVNVEHFAEWNTDPDFIYWVMRFLDNNVTLFLEKAPPEMWRAKKSAELERSVGLGQMGHHLYLQNMGIPWESPMAVGQTLKIAKHIKKMADQASQQLGAERGPAPIMSETGDRFAHKIAIAPNASIAPICGNTSPSIEPYISNTYSQKGMSGSFLVKNKALDTILTNAYGLSDTDKERVWSSITVNSGSVQHLDFMSDAHKELFKTSREIDQLWMIEHAAVRQPFVCQGQSVNIFVPAEIDRQKLHNIHKVAWQKGLKSLYYCRSKSASSVSQLYDHSLEGIDVAKHLNQKEEAVKIEDLQGQLIADNEYASACLSCQG